MVCDRMAALCHSSHILHYDQDVAGGQVIFLVWNCYRILNQSAPKIMPGLCFIQIGKIYKFQR